MIFCNKCGNAHFGYTNKSGKRYYRHSKYHKKDCGITLFISADELENIVVIKLIKTFGDVEKIKEAIYNVQTLTLNN